MALFDSAAQNYDQEFSHTLVGRAMRWRVWGFLERKLALKGAQKTILELNCGTGEDAFYLCAMGHRMICTDLSSSMLAITNEKNNNHRELLSTHIVDLADPNFDFINTKIDFVFSNFGGLNCLDQQQLKNLSSSLSQNLDSGAYFSAVVMPKYCLMESLYFLLKGNWRSIFRRNTDKALAVPVSDNMVATWYYSPMEFSHLFSNEFVLDDVRPIGIVLPPSYLNPFFEKHPLIFALAKRMENVLGRFAIFASVADHFIILLRKK